MNIKKYTKGAMTGLIAHCERTKTNAKYIDSSRTKMNYDVNQIYQKGRNSQQRLDDILANKKVTMLNRKDVNVCIDCVVTAPTNQAGDLTLANDELEKFFVMAHQFLADRYGRKIDGDQYDNIVSAYIHMDESTPHMHFIFVPLVEKKKDKDKPITDAEYKVSAKDVITYKDLKTLHPDMSDWMKQCFKRDIGIANGHTKDGNQSVKQLKQKSELEADIKKLKSDKADLEKSVSLLSGQTHQLTNDKERLERQNNQLKANAPEAENLLKQLVKIVNERLYDYLPKTLQLSMYPLLNQTAFKDIKASLSIIADTFKRDDSKKQNQSNKQHLDRDDREYHFI